MALGDLVERLFADIDSYLKHSSRGIVIQRVDYTDNNYVAEFLNKSTGALWSGVVDVTDRKYTEKIVLAATDEFNEFNEITEGVMPIAQPEATVTTEKKESGQTVKEKHGLLDSGLPVVSAERIARVTGSIGVTQNTGNFCSFRAEIGWSVPVDMTGVEDNREEYLKRMTSVSNDLVVWAEGRVSKIVQENTAVQKERSFQGLDSDLKS